MPQLLLPIPRVLLSDFRIFFGNGCFWGRQKDFVDVEMLQLGRQPSNISAVAGYAGGPYTAMDGRVCYYYGPPEVRKQT